MQIENIVAVKKLPLIDIHGESCQYQVIWQDDDHGRLFGTKKPDDMKSFTNFARLTINPGKSNNLHTHEGIEQVYFVLQGEGTVQVGEKQKPAKAGDVIFLPADIQHGFFNTGTKQVILLLVGTSV
ncbi:MAG: cupin domain-containing protein [Candidatus Bathyarchaeota archaeon]|nr:cupin domain-containing protein [Candidatus Bathyarchaeota archaeon]